MDAHRVIQLGLAPPAGGRPGDAFVQLVSLVLIIGVFYFLVIAPMRKKQRKHAEMLAELKAGDKVITSGGVHGTIVGVSDDVVQLKIANEVRIELSKSAVSGLRQESS